MSIQVDNVTVRFGGVTALSGISMSLTEGQIVTVIGPNGSGKSTLFNAITGLVPIAEGVVRIGGTDMVHTPAYLRIARGLARSFQTPRFDPRVSVQDAVLCGFYPVSRAGIFGSMLRSPRVSREERAFLDDCKRILEDFRLSNLSHKTMGELPMGQVRLVEVARAIANQPRYLLLDEPAAGLTKVEQGILIAEIRRLAGTGVGILLVEHNFAMVRELGDEALVLDCGEMLLRGKPADLMHDPAFIDAYLGTSHSHQQEKAR